MRDDEEITNDDYAAEIGDPKLIRELYIKDHFLRIAKEIFNDNDCVNSLVMCISQYWDDEAGDAVHIKFIPASFASCFSSWRDLFDRTKNEAIKKCGLDIREGYISMYGSFFQKYDIPYLDNNEGMIQAFGPFCKEGSSQEDSHFDCYTPYAIAIRDEKSPNGIKLNTFDKFLPWM